MRYEMVTTETIELPERSAVLKNVDSQGAITVQLITNKTVNLVLYAGQTITYTNAKVYVRTSEQRKKVRLQIEPLSIVNATVDNLKPEEPETLPSPQYLPLTGGTVTGDLIINGTLIINGEEFLIADDEDLQKIIDAMYAEDDSQPKEGDDSYHCQTASDEDIQNIIEGLYKD